MYKNYIFDLYGTLIDIHTDESKENLWLEMARLYAGEGAGYTPEALKKGYEDGCRSMEEALRRKKQVEYPEIEIGEVFGDLLLQKGITVERKTIEGLAYRFRELSRDYMRLYSGTRPLLQRLKQEGKRIYLLSNAQRLFTAPEIEETGIGEYFDDIFISSDFGIKKPEKKYLETLIHKHGLKREECLMIGNEPESDMEVARRCGVDGWLVKDGAFDLNENISQLGIMKRSSFLL